MLCALCEIAVSNWWQCNRSPLFENHEKDLKKFYEVLSNVIIPVASFPDRPNQSTF